MQRPAYHNQFFRNFVIPSHSNVFPSCVSHHTPEQFTVNLSVQKALLAPLKSQTSKTPRVCPLDFQFLPLLVPTSAVHVAGPVCACMGHHIELVAISIAQNPHQHPTVRPIL